MPKTSVSYDSCYSCPLYAIRRKHNLLPVVPGGAIPARFTLVFINPTPRNVTIHSSWKGERLVFYGDFRFWKFLANVGLFDKELVRLVQRKGWLPEFVPIFRESLARHGVWLTDLVKCPTMRGEYPPKEAFTVCKNLFWREMEVVRPGKIIAFGVITYRALTGKNIKLKDFYKNLTEEVVRKEKILPCYFPTGRGRTDLAVDMLRKILRWAR